MVCCYRITQSGRVKNSVCGGGAGKEGGKTRKGDGDGFFYSYKACAVDTAKAEEVIDLKYG